MEQTNQSNEQTKKVNLLDLPREILEHILIHLDDDKQFLAASHVCKLFASVAETAFARKYSNEYYTIDCLYKRSLGTIMLNKYGEKIRKIMVIGDYEGLLDLIEQECCNLERVTLIDVPKMIILKDLKKVILKGIPNLNRETFTEFINNNQQLESFVFDDTGDFLLDLLDRRLKNLKT